MAVLDKKTFLILYKSLIRPKLEYNNTVWWPGSKLDVSKLEGVQRRATKLVPELKHLSNTEKLKILNLPTLNYRRIRGDCIQVYKYLNDYYDVNWSALFILNESNYNTRGHSYKLAKVTHNSTTRSKFFTVRVVNYWNALPEEIVYATSLNAFKNAFDEHWKNNPMKFDPDCI